MMQSHSLYTFMLNFCFNVVSSSDIIGKWNYSEIIIKSFNSVLMDYKAIESVRII